MLADKIKEYLLKNEPFSPYIKTAEKIAEIADEHYFGECPAHSCLQIKKVKKENAEYQKGMIADAKIIKEADNKIIELEAKLKTEIMTISKCVGEWKKIIAGLEEKISILEVKAVARNGRILDLEQHLQKSCDNESYLINRIEKFEGYIKEIEGKFADIKYLDRQEVENEFEKLSVDELQDCSFGGVINAICSLAIKPIDKDKI